MNIKFFNIEQQKLVDFIPSEIIKLYCCGPTIYNDIHVGNSRPIIIFDGLACFLRNYYKYDNKKVMYIRNITDIDEKIINGVLSNSLNLQDNTYENFINIQLNNFQNLMKYIESFDVINKRVTESIHDIIQLIQQLIINNKAYVTDKGNVYFKTNQCPIYKILGGSQRNDEPSISVVNEDDKLYWEDFALWKRVYDYDHIITKGIYQGDNVIFWSSPWGNGLPGWHMECSTIIKKFLGDTIDIHGGGEDLKFPHHDNEIAQCWGLSNQLFCKIWLHNGMVLINGKKMAKSTGNFIKLNDIVHNRDDGYVLKYLILSTHYRQPLNFTHGKWQNSYDNVEKIKKFLINNKNIWDYDQYINYESHYIKTILDCMAIDFNTVAAFTYLHYCITEFKSLIKIDQTIEAQKYFFNVIIILDSLGLDFYKNYL